MIDVPNTVTDQLLAEFLAVGLILAQAVAR